MQTGYRVVSPGEVGRWGPGVMQISVYKRWGDGGLTLMERVAQECVAQGLRYVVHPVGYFLLKDDPGELAAMAECADLALILHDEWGPKRSALEGPEHERFLKAVAALESRAKVSFENANNTRGAVGFWERYARSVTLDLGHVEAAGLDSVQFVRALPKGVIEMVEFVHMHHNAGLRGGLTDHWPLEPGCRELRALAELLGRKADVTAILELNDIDETQRSLALLDEL